MENSVTSTLPASASNSTITYNRPVSALEDPANYNIRHPLQSKWTLWYRASTKPNSSAVKNAAKSDNWEASLQCVNTVDTIEDFWGMYNNVPGIEKMEDSSDYMFFKEGIRPAWEDPANANGGSYTLQLKGPSTTAVGEFLWLNTMMMVVGSTLTHFDKVTGIFYARRSNRSDRLSLWLTTNDRDICRQCETEWMDLLNKVNMEGFNFGTTSFTNHKVSAGHHGSRGGDRDNRGGDRGERGEREYRGDRDSRDNRDNREYRGDRDNRDNREYRDRGGDRFERDGRDNRDNRDRGGRPGGSGKFSRGGGSSGAFGSNRQSSDRTAGDWSRQ